MYIYINTYIYIYMYMYVQKVTARVTQECSACDSVAKNSYGK